VTYALNYAVSRYDPWSWHVANLLLHGSVALSLFLLGRRLFGSWRGAPIAWLSEAEGDRASLAAAVVFAVHPVTSGCANYMWARSTLLADALMLPAAVCYLAALRRAATGDALAAAAPREAAAGEGTTAEATTGQATTDEATIGEATTGVTGPSAATARSHAEAPWLWAALGLYTLALWTKIEAASLFGVLVLVELLLSPGRQGEPLLSRLRPRRSDLRLLPFAAVLAAYFLVRHWLVPAGQLEAWAATGVTRWTYLLTQFRAWWYYVGQLLAPVQMVADYSGYPVSGSILEPRVLLAVAGWAAVGVLLWLAIRRAPAVAFLGLAYFVHLAPTSSLAPLAEMVNEHRPYLPVAGLVLLLAVGATVLIRRCTERPALLLAGVTLLLAVPLAAVTRDRNRVWRDSLTYWRDVVAKDPGASPAQMNYG
jgi:hypothetical protein